MDSNFDKDLYRMLEIKKDATQDEIKKAFRKLAHKYHPDKNGGDDKKFKQINAAYQILNNPKKRSEYDLHYGLKFGFDSNQEFKKENTQSQKAESKQEQKKESETKNNTKAEEGQNKKEKTDFWESAFQSNQEDIKK
jgi:curved DNA-binding protein CbpA